jgi:hypothetical protein
VFSADVASEQQADKALVRLEDDEAPCNGDGDDDRGQGKPDPGIGVAVLVEAGIGEPRADRRAPNALNALEISMLREARGSGNSLALLSAMKLVRKSRGLERCSRRCDRTKSISSHAMSMHDYLNTCVLTAFRSTLGCGPTFGAAENL